MDRGGTGVEFMLIVDKSYLRRSMILAENFTSNFFPRTEERVRRAEGIIFDTKLVFLSNM